MVPSGKKTVLSTQAFPTSLKPKRSQKIPTLQEQSSPNFNRSLGQIKTGRFLVKISGFSTGFLLSPKVCNL